MKKFLIILVSLIFLIAIFAIVYYGTELNKKNDSSGSTVFEISEGESRVSISKRLFDEKIISSEAVFLIYVKINDKIIHSGSYLLKKDLSILEVVDRLSRSDTVIVKITIPEGYRAEQIAAELYEKARLDYSSSLKKLSVYEGYLYPDTYFLMKDSTVDDLITMMQKNYVKKTAGLTVTGQDIILASIVEREAVSDADRPIIAGIYKNRISAGMKLEADPTVYFANDSIELLEMSESEKREYVFWKKVDFSDYKNIDHPSNTYIYRGVPPEPICNPGIASIRATINYDQNDYYYFFHDSAGEIYPSKTATEHENKKLKYLF